MKAHFFTASGTAVAAVTAEQMGEIDRIAATETGPNLSQMMENAGRSLAEFTFTTLGGLWNRVSVVVLAGIGRNGGGGICAARHLANRGIDVRLVLAAPDRLCEIAVFQRRIYELTPGREATMDDLVQDSPDIVLDALIGYGLTSAPEDRTRDLIQWANSSKAEVISLDIPSGVDATSGETPGDFVKPHSTVTLALPKTGLLRHVTGQFILADVGIPAGVFRRIGLDYESPFEDSFLAPLRIER